MKESLSFESFVFFVCLVLVLFLLFNMEAWNWAEVKNQAKEAVSMLAAVACRGAARNAVVECCARGSDPCGLPQTKYPPRSF